MEYRIRYDPAADAVYIGLREDEVAESVEIDEGVIADLNDRGEVVGVEILSFSSSGVDLNELIKRGALNFRDSDNSLA